LKSLVTKKSKPIQGQITMGVTSFFHDALILSIVEMTKENDDYSIFDFIKLMISETNWILSPGERDFGDEPIAKYVKKHIDGQYSYPLIGLRREALRERSLNLYRDCLVKIHKALNGDWDVSWFDLLTYLLFIQSNCHHKGGNTNSHKLCRSPDSFLDFFYKSKAAFNPWLPWEIADRLRYGRDIKDIPETKTAELRGEWWVSAFEREKKTLLLFETLAPTHYLGKRLTTGWVVRGLKPGDGDILPQGSVLNQLRDHYGLPELSGDYGLGVMSVTSKVTDVPELKDKDKDKDKDTVPNDEKMCVYFNLGICVGFGIVFMNKFIDAKNAK
tara:strand:+ start:178 stop:1164 length:987 start_codon:yes stop_codon:yes gene_type:complete